MAKCTTDYHPTIHELPTPEPHILLPRKNESIPRRLLLLRDKMAFAVGRRLDPGYFVWDGGTHTARLAAYLSS